MHESREELEALQSLLDRSYRSAGEHLLSIHTAERRLSADQVSSILIDVCVLDLATVNSSGHPIVAPIDGLFLGGQFWFGSAESSLRFTHIRRNPNVSAAHTRGEEISILVHGKANEIDTSTGSYERFHEYCREVYGTQYDSWDYWDKAPLAWIEPRRMYAIRIAAKTDPAGDLETV